jgi:PAS domain S-box-containing protein
VALAVAGMPQYSISYSMTSYKPPDKHVRTIILGVITLILGSALGLLGLCAKFVLLPSFVALEEQEIIRNVGRAEDLITRQVLEIDTITGDYSGWDEAYRFVQDGNPQFIATSLDDAIFPQLRINFLLFLDITGQPRYAKGFDYRRNLEIPLPSSLARLEPIHPLLIHPSPASRVTGVLRLPEGILLVASRPVLKSDYSGPAKGTMIIGRYLDAELVQEIADSVRLPMAVFPVVEKMPPEIREVVPALRRELKPQLRIANQDTIAGYALFRDLWDEDAFILKIEEPRSIYHHGLGTVRYFLFWVLAISLTAGGTFFLLLDRLFLSLRQEQESEARYRSVVEQTAEGVVLLTPETFRIIEANAAFAELIGLPMARLKNLALSDLMAMDGAAARNEIHRSIRTRREISFTNQDGTVRMVELSATRITFQHTGALAVLTHEITERKQYEEELRKNERYLLLALEAGRMGAFDWQIGTDKLEWSDGHYSLLGYKPGEIKSDPVTFLRHVHPEDRPRQEKLLRESMEQQKEYLCEFRVIWPDGSIHWLEARGRYVYDAKGVPLRMYGVTMDIDAKKQSEEELQKAQKLESIGLLAGGIAHDFNNILTAILGNIELARMFMPAEEKAHERLAVAERAAIRARSITRQLLTFAKGGAPVKRVVSVPHLVRESVNFALQGANVKAEYILPADLWRAEVDENQLEQVLNNLAINAAQAMPEGGTLRITARNELIGRDSPRELQEGRYIHIEIVDQGTGIPLEHLDKIFDPYFTTKERGSGLGLAISYSIIKKHGGTITAESVPGQGSTFTILLPATEKSEPGSPAVAEWKQLSGGNQRILVMDDEDAVNAVAAEMLQLLGYRVETARDGKQAVTIYQEAMAAGEPFAAVITDLTVPGGMGGKETARRLLQLDPKARIIVSSGYANDPIMSDYPVYGFMNVVPKPYRMAELARKLQEVIAT